MTGTGQRVELHGWDAQARAWHGPDELTFTMRGSWRILGKLRAVPGSWYGKLRAQMPGEPPVSFCASIHDLGDSALAILDIDGSPGGPLEVLLVVPEQRRAHIRAELAFEFVSFLRFLEGRDSLGSEMAIHDYVHGVLADCGAAGTLVFSIETQPLPPEVHLLICQQTERLVIALIQWMAEKDAKG